MVAVGLSMDAFAVALCKGLGMKKLNLVHAGIIALFFAVFQAVMPLIGWFLGTQFASIITPIDHWVAFVLLGYIGGKMIWDATHDKDEALACDIEQKLDIKELLMLAVATSIDALVVGITLSTFITMSVGAAVTIIGLITLVLSFVGVTIGNKFGTRYQKKAEILGGAVLIVIGVKILVDHMGLLG